MVALEPAIKVLDESVVVVVLSGPAPIRQAQHDSAPIRRVATRKSRRKEGDCGSDAQSAEERLHCLSRFYLRMASERRKMPKEGVLKSGGAGMYPDPVATPDFVPFRTLCGAKSA
ncbi:MAG: hypothetical protein AMXMBFR19_00530 [Chthonomonadaceae bacterium]|uniref:Uncharacterized protein n=1 Tax=Candidatus Nitrosymbiomonas proteolyticus TaxID=2608984 RepID=A0A809SD78_9BACT|nr:hypothetical protein NPRO_04090 [Candidatus Nitrosymbiomonas proteolyticus]